MKKRYIFYGIVAVIIILVASLYIIEPQYSYVPPEDNILNEAMNLEESLMYDLWGVTIKGDDFTSDSLLAQGKGGPLSESNGAIKVDEEFITLGRELFYNETFNNEVFITDILGMLDGPLTVMNISKAILELRGGYTDNLQVELAEDVTIGDQTFKKGEKINTGLDVAKGSLTPLGMPISFSEGRLKAGVSCAACHASVDMKTGMVVEGAPNKNFNGGLLLALATNSAAYFTNTDMDAEKLKEYITEHTPTIRNEDGEEVSLPDAHKFEQAVDEMLIKWPAGNFDSTMDMVNNPTQIPDSFTLGDHPYGWNGFAAVGPFKGLSSLNNNVHAQNSDILAQAGQSEPLFNIDKDQFIGTILQNSANKHYRYNPESDMTPSQFLASIDEEPKVPGVNEMVKPPNYPKVSMYSPNGTIVSSPGFHVGEQINAMSAYQNALVPPKYNQHVDEYTLATGRDVFNRAGCLSCHAGPTYTNHEIIPQREIKTEPSRAKSFKDLPDFLGKSLTYSPDTPVPVPEDATILEVPTEHVDEEKKKLVFAKDKDGKGGYKVKGLIGLAWSPPYLHDGGVSVGPNPNTDLGLPGTVMKGINPDPYHSLRAVVDRTLRENVVEANKANKQLQGAHVDGSGHEYWVDEESGFTKEEQEALVKYLLSLTSSGNK
ncbi:electron transport protein [Alkalihalobacillus sp. LMS39]|uniref:electron transport protein n=1 Tax=Alkalihalobacillus sp. LMS39 TaxID=2924032 RepID=UPI001FB31A37|nr:electron transport protein [Alkalihalobacillus sp. LMS39]UOE93165.1 electron transport protein [Alkalihalobacillus sp. LMS39]